MCASLSVVINLSCHFYHSLKMRKERLGMVVRVYNSSYSEGRGRRSVVPGYPRQKYEILSKKETKTKRTRA
jgi:hypothetical protein